MALVCDIERMENDKVELQGSPVKEIQAEPEEGKQLDENEKHPSPKNSPTHIKDSVPESNDSLPETKDVTSVNAPPPAPNEDLEDGEIEDDDDDEEIAAQATGEPAQAQEQQNQDIPPESGLQLSPGKNSADGKFPEGKFGSPNNRFHGKHRDRRRYDRREDRRGSGDDRSSGKHLTEAEKSVMYLHKLERMEREKRDKYKREHGILVDDFASNIEKAIANVLKKEQKDKEGNVKTSDEEKDDVKRGKKRKKKDKDKRRSKQRKIESPKGENMSVDDKERSSGNTSDTKVFNSPRDGVSNDRSPSGAYGSRSPSSRSENDEAAGESDASSNRNIDDKSDRRSGKDRRHHKKNSHSRSRNNRDRRDRKHNNQDKSKDKKHEPQPKDAQTVCLFYLQGKCQKGGDCPFSHEAVPSVKLELCKFYLKDCCAKGDKCLYMHSEFPCKYYHTGLKCFAEENCKFSHGKPLSGGLKQILFKHIETAPKEILGDFPRLTRDGALDMINQTQRTLETKYGVEGTTGGEGNEGEKDAIPSLFDINVRIPGDVQNDGAFSDTKSKPKSGNRERKSRWQDADPSENASSLHEQQVQMALRIKGFYTERDHDMRYTSNGDVDMRTLPPPHLPIALPPLNGPTATTLSNSFQQMVQPAMSVPATLPNLSSELSFAQDGGDVDIRNPTSFFDNKDVDIRRPLHNFSSMDVDNRQIDFAKDVDIRNFRAVERSDIGEQDLGDENSLQIITEDGGLESTKDVDNRVQHFDSTGKDVEPRSGFNTNLPPNLPKKQMELFMRIQAQQKDAVADVQGPKVEENDDANVDWYSDDDDDGRLMIKDEIDDIKPKIEELREEAPPSQIKPNEVMEKLGDLSKIDISAEVTKLLSSISQGSMSPKEQSKPSQPKDPRLVSQAAGPAPLVVEPPKMSPADPRRNRVPSTENKTKETKLSVYEQVSLSIENAKKDVDLRNVGKDVDLRSGVGDLDLRGGTRTDIDLRNLNLPFKAIQNYTPATEIDATINSHAPITWKVSVVDIPQPDYTGLKLTVQDAHATGDPRLRKIFRLSVDENESPASPKESPKATQQTRVDPRRRKVDESRTDSQMTYSQQMNVLQSSAFYQSLTSNQKVLLNQELAAKADGSGSNDPVLTGLLSNLGLLPSVSVPTGNNSAMSILANVNSTQIGPGSNINPSMMGPMHMGQNPNLMGQNPNLMGQNPNLIGQNPNMMGQNPNLMGQNQNLMGPNPNLMGPNPNLMGQNPNLMSQNTNQGMMGPNGPPGLMGQPSNFPMVGPNMMSQTSNTPGLLGPGPPPGEFQLNFDPRQGGLLGNAPIDFPPVNYGPGGDEYYPEGGDNMGGGGGSFRGGNNRNEGRGYGRDNRQRRGRNFNNRNGGRNFRNRNNNRANNRSRTPP